MILLEYIGIFFRYLSYLMVPIYAIVGIISVRTIRSTESYGEWLIPIGISLLCIVLITVITSVKKITDDYAKQNIILTLCTLPSVLIFTALIVYYSGVQCAFLPCEKKSVDINITAPS